jgi:phosphate uptake regulator
MKMPLPTTIDDTALYRIVVNQPVKIDPDGRVVMLPSTDNVVKGSFLRAMDPNVVDSSALVEPPAP